MAGMRVPFGLLLLGVVAVLSAQNGGGNRRWERYEPEMQDPADDPPDAWVDAEFVFARLRYRSPRNWGGYARWGIDANKSERQFLQGVRRLTRIDARSVEEILDLSSDSVYDFPWLYAVSPGDWSISDAEGARLREHFGRGGSLMVDDFHNEREWATFMAGIDKMCPGATVIEIADDDPIFHVLYDLDERVRVSGLNVVHGSQIERGGVHPHWRAVLDAKGRVVVAAWFNQDLGDAWEWADLPDYPEKYASMAYKLGINSIIYAMTH